jgi:pimeloyl-ACP methyl ester carboxylesterase
MTPPRTAAPLADATAGAKTIVLEGTGHMMPVERPDETLDALIAAL